MKKVEILASPNPILRKKSKEVEKIDEKIKTVIENMTIALEASEIEGLAIAAPQIGESVRIILVRVNEARDKDGKLIQKAIPLTAFINPVITKLSKDKVILDEGCLSYPGYFGPVERPKKIRFEAITIGGKREKMNASGLLARIVQHEVDHLDGILFIDLITDKSKLTKGGDIDVRKAERNKKR
ncbi:MAG: peptide deformylase [bacterium]|nr:peptide deformylase [bacterium]